MQAERSSPALRSDKKRIYSILNIILIFVAAGIYLGTAFFESLWFDEAYTVGAVSCPMFRMIKYISYDVHPHFYYIILKAWSYLFGNGVIALRLFSAIFGVACVALGYTHIRKDFGEEAGFWFSFFIAFSFSTLKYSHQIRMYTLGIFLVTLTAIYAYRRIKSNCIKNRTLYLVFAVLSAYTQYFAFFIVAMLNVFTLARAIKRNKEQKGLLKEWAIDAIIQFGLYAPGIFVFLLQIAEGGADWITVTYPDALYDTFCHPFTGDVLSEVLNRESIAYDIAGIVSVLLIAVASLTLVNNYRNNKEAWEAPFTGYSLCAAVVVFSLAVSLVRPIFYVRYTILFKGLFMFAIASLMSSLKRGYIKAIIAVLLIACFIITAIPFWEVNLFGSNDSTDEKLDVAVDDLIVTDDLRAIVFTTLHPENEVVIYDVNNWNLDMAFQACGPNANVVYDLSPYGNFEGRVWASGGAAFSFFDNCNSFVLVEEISFHTDYYEYDLTFRLYESV